MSLPTWALNSGGTAIASPLRVVTGLEAVLVRIQTCLQVVRGDWPDDVLYGLPMMEWASPSASEVEIEATLRQQLGQLPGVYEVQSVRAVRADGIAIAARVLIVAGDSAAVAVVGDLASEGSVISGAWYLLLQVGPVQSIIPGIF